MNAKKAIIGLVFLFLIMPGNAFALTSRQELTNIEKQIKAVNSEIKKKRAEKETLASEVAVIEGQIRKTELSIKAANTEIAILTAEIDTTTKQIAKTNAELKVEHDKMAEYLRVIYEEGNTSLVEQIFKAQTFSDFVDRKEYLTSTQLKLKEVADKIAKLKKELEAKNAQLNKDKIRTTKLKDSLLAQKTAQATQKAYKDQLLAAIRQQERGMQSKLNDLHARKAALSATYGEAVIGGSSAYPYGNPPARRIIDTPDPWGYLIGECTSYVAWKRMTIGKPVPRGLGNARTWGTRAAAMGLSVTSTPRPGDVMVMPYIGGYGHVAFVEAVYGPGKVLISEYNWKPYSYSRRTVNPYNYGAQFIH